MGFYKFADSELAQANIQDFDKLAHDIDLDIEKRMAKFANDLKVIAPQAKDFLYFTCVMMHAAEAACYNPDGTPKKTASGEDVSARWDKLGEGVVWTCNDSSIMPYRNNNRDIFPEAELKVAYKNWVGRPLCLDHQSQSVDKIRGVIVDTVYDDKRKRVIALCALDQKNYPDLADKVRTGVATNVSMGTAVGKAVCTESGCHTVARTERDFCQHMRAKSCYGEINMELSPIELSLVVSGADPQAKVKHIIASDVEKAAEMLTDYLQIKEASDTGVSTQDLESVKKDLANLTDKISVLTSKETNDATGMTASKSMESTPLPSHNVTEVNAPSAMPMYASELQRAVLGAQTKIASLQENLSRLSNEEPTMTNKKTAYFQGTEEPKPGQQQYPVDPANERGRLMDKNLHGPAPFPNTGDVEGLYPGDEEKKRELLRLADENERAEFRRVALEKAKAQLSKKSYFQGTEEPKDGGTAQYPVDPLNDKAREEDKTLVGAPPFPGVGDIEGLYGDDMKTKEKLSRAALKARFKKATAPDGRVDKGASKWVVFANDQPIIEATVDQISRGNSDSLYDGIATESFGRSILDRIQSQGFQATASALLKKKAQDPAAAVAPAPVPEAAPPADLDPPAEVPDEAGDPAEVVADLQALNDELAEKLSDLEGKVSGPVADDAEGLGDVPPAGDDEFAPPATGAAPAPKSAAQLQGMRKRVNGMLQEGIRETVASLKKHLKEISAAKGVYANYTAMNEKQRDYLNGLTIDAVKDARAVLADTNKLMEAVVKYAYGTAELEKRAAAEAKLQKKASPETVDSLLSEIDFDGDPSQKALSAVEDALRAAEAEITTADTANTDFTVTQDGDQVGTLNTDTGTIELNSQAGAKLDTKASRAEARVKLAQKGLLGFNELSQQAHPGGSADAVSAANLDVKPTAPDAAFHVYKDLKTKMENLANMPPRVRKQAERIQELVSEGKLDPSRVDELTSHGVDQEAVSYWKSFYGEAKDSESNEFASKLVAEHTQAKQAQEMDDYKGRVKRAYDMAHQMVGKGMIEASQIEYQVGEIMKYNQAGFDSVKRLIEKQAAVKTASVPQVGLLSSGDVILPAAQRPTQAGGADIKGFFDAYFNEKGMKF